MLTVKLSLALRPSTWAKVTAFSLKVHTVGECDCLSAKVFSESLFLVCIYTRTLDQYLVKSINARASTISTVDCSEVRWGEGTLNFQAHRCYSTRRSTSS